jgi:hypothetical protein
MLDPGTGRHFPVTLPSIIPIFNAGRSPLSVFGFFPISLKGLSPGTLIRRRIDGRNREYRLSE